MLSLKASTLLSMFVSCGKELESQSSATLLVHSLLSYLQLSLDSDIEVLCELLSDNIAGVPDTLQSLKLSLLDPGSCPKESANIISPSTPESAETMSLSIVPKEFDFLSCLHWSGLLSFEWSFGPLLTRLSEMLCPFGEIEDLVILLPLGGWGTFLLLSSKEASENFLEICKLSS